MRRKMLEGFLIGVIILTFSALCFGGMESENYRISKSVQSAGGAFMASENYVMFSTLGQASGIGRSSSASYGVQAGFWISILTKGDVNGDGKVDLADLVLSLQLLIGMSASDVHRGADVNGDGHIGLAEAIFVLGKAAGLRD
jgi:hypothetical protein